MSENGAILKNEIQDAKLLSSGKAGVKYPYETEIGIFEDRLRHGRVKILYKLDSHIKEKEDVKEEFYLARDLDTQEILAISVEIDKDTPDVSALLTKMSALALGHGEKIKNWLMAIMMFLITALILQDYLYLEIPWTNPFLTFLYGVMIVGLFYQLRVYKNKMVFVGILEADLVQEKIDVEIKYKRKFFSARKILSVELHRCKLLFTEHATKDQLRSGITLEDIVSNLDKRLREENRVLKEKLTSLQEKIIFMEKKNLALLNELADLESRLEFMKARGFAEAVRNLNANPVENIDRDQGVLKKNFKWVLLSGTAIVVALILALL